jgi:hypothetical protein
VRSITYRRLYAVFKGHETIQAPAVVGASHRPLQHMSTIPKGREADLLDLVASRQQKPREVVLAEAFPLCRVPGIEAGQAATDCLHGEGNAPRSAGKRTEEEVGPLVIPRLGQLAQEEAGFGRFVEDPGEWSLHHPTLVCPTLRISCEAVPPSVLPAGAQGGTSACHTGAALSFVSCIRLLGGFKRAPSGSAVRAPQLASDKRQTGPTDGAN